jgi:hypothetical protein
MHRLPRGKWCSFSLSFALVLSVFVYGPVATTQEPAQPELTLTDDLQSPGKSTLISLSVRAREGVAVSKVVSEISYRGDVLLFQEVIRGLSAEAVQADVKAIARPRDGENASVEVTVTAKEGSEIPNGVIADLRFKVADDAPTGTTVTLSHKGSVWAKGAMEPIDMVKVTGSKIEISATAPLPACFFYMH